MRRSARIKLRSVQALILTSDNVIEFCEGMKNISCFKDDLYNIKPWVFI
jgi:hypothetical protein